MKNRIISVLLAAALLCMLLPGAMLTASAADTSGKCGENANWSYDASTGTLTISGTGSVQTLDLMMGKLWGPYIEQIKSVVVQPGITELGGYAFAGAKQLQDVSLPDTLTSMIDMVFANCSSLKTVTLPDSIVNMGGGVFMDCTSLTSVKLPSKLRVIWSQMFMGCTALTSVTLPAEVNTIMIRAFSGCSGIDALVLPETVSSIEEEAFDKCGKLTLTILNPDCKIETNTPNGNTLGELDGTTIRCYEDSTALAYAKEYGYQYVSLGKPTFTDVAPDAYYADSVAWALNSGITKGTTPTTFSPDSTCTRAQVVTFLWRARGSWEPKSDECPFTDVPADAYYYKAVLWAKENGITTGASATTFGPDSPCTRAQVVTFLWRAKGAPFTELSTNAFLDVPKDAYYARAVNWAANDGITTGTSPDRFSPESTCTRAQIVTFLYRAYTEQ